MIPHWKLKKIMDEVPERKRVEMFAFWCMLALIAVSLLAFFFGKN